MRPRPVLRRAAGARTDGRRLVAYSLYDFGDSAFATTVATVLFSQYYAGTVAGGASGVRIWGQQIPGATLFAWLVALSMTVVALAAPFLGIWADRRGSRIRALALFWLPGVALTLALAGVGRGEWIEGGLLFALAYVCFAGASIFYNALLPEVGPPETLGRSSGIAWGVGYLGGGLLLVLNLIMLRNPTLLGFPEGRFTINDCFASAGWWWFLFALPLFWVFRYEDSERRRHRRAAAVLPESGAPAARSPGDVSAVVRQAGRTCRELWNTAHLRRFFLAYLLYNDGVQTVIAMASIFGAQELGMSATSLILFFLLIQATAFLGPIVLGALADRAGHKPVLLVCVAAWTAFTAWAAAVGVFGNALREYWILGGAAGLFLGGIQSCSRSMIAQWVPRGRESELFGFFSIMSRVASIFGPLLYGALVLFTGSLRGAILSVTLLFLVGGVLLLRVDPKRIPEEQEKLATGRAAGAV